MSFDKKQKLFLGIAGGLLLALVVVEGYVVIDQAVTISYMKDGYRMTEAEMTAVIAIINKTDLSKGQIEESLRSNPGLEEIELTGDTIRLYQHELIFMDRKLVKIVPFDSLTKICP